MSPSAAEIFYEVSLDI